MEERQWERYAALVGGILFVVLAVLSSVLPGQPPDLTDKAGEFTKYFKDHADDIKVAAYLSGLAFVPILAWLGALWRTLRRAENGDPRLTVAAAGGLIVTGACIMVATAIQASVALRIDDLGDASRYFATLVQSLYGVGSFGLAVLVGATGVIIVRSGVFPKWLGIASGALGIGWLVAGVGAVSTASAWMGVGFAMFLLWAVWIVTLSVLMYRQDASA